MRQADPLGQATAYRDTTFRRNYEHCLFVKGPSVKPYAESQEVQVSGLPETDYGLTFLEDGTPAGGEGADKITVTITYNRSKKDTVMLYDADLGKYTYNQYGKLMQDQITGETEAFENVVVMFANITVNNIYQVADFVAGGDGYYACGGKIIPILWGADSDDQPLWFTTLDGEPLEMGVGNTYIAITDSTKGLSYE